MDDSTPPLSFYHFSLSNSLFHFQNFFPILSLLSAFVLCHVVDLHPPSPFSLSSNVSFLALNVLMFQCFFSLLLLRTFGPSPPSVSTCSSESVVVDLSTAVHHDCRSWGLGLFLDQHSHGGRSVNGGAPWCTGSGMELSCLVPYIFSLFLLPSSNLFAIGIFL